MATKLEIDISQKGLRKILKGYEEEALRVFWRSPQSEYTTRAVWDQVNQRLGPGSISRASIINFLEDMASMGVLKRTEIAGKGGYRGIFTSNMNL